MTKKKFEIHEGLHDITTNKTRGNLTLKLETKPQANNVTNISSVSTCIRIPENSSTIRSFNFAPYYGQGFDTITALCQSTIEKLIAQSTATGQSSLAASSIVSYCRGGLINLFAFLKLWRSGTGNDLQAMDITPELVKEYIVHLKSLGISPAAQKNYYTLTKSLLVATHTQGYLPHVNIKHLFPRNPFPNSNRKFKGQRPLSQTEKRQLVGALKVEMTRILAESKPLTSYDLTICILTIGLVTGLNPIPVIYLPTDCIQPHPLKKNLCLLVAFKRRGNATQVMSLRHSQDIELLRSVKLQVANTIDMIIERNSTLRNCYKDPMRLLVYESNGNTSKGRASAMALGNLPRNINILIEKHQLTNDDGHLLKLSMMRLRKTFVNRMWELSDQDPLIAARQGKHSPYNANRHYWEAPPEAEANMRFLGEARINELRASYGAKENTPVAGCKDTLNGHRAPKNGSVCTEILNCFRCRSFVVTEDDLYRLLSFYWAVVRERDSYGIKNWNKYLRHIIRIIDEDIAPQFDKQVEHSIREKAKTQPHPFWRDLTMIRLAKG